MESPKRKYVIITELEFDALLRHDKGWVKSQQGSEVVYSYTTKKNPNVVVKVYSSINPSGLSKKCGGDAIRVCAVNTATQKGIIKSSRVYRTPGWDVRTKAKVLDVISKIF